MHHSQAVEMASIALTPVARTTTVRNLAYDILTTQQNQIGQMQGWLPLWGEPSLPTGGLHDWMIADHGMRTGHSATHGGCSAVSARRRCPAWPARRRWPRCARPPAPRWTCMFLQLMLRHHQGGLPDDGVRRRARRDPAVRQLAQTMVDTQTSESTLMTQMLSERGAAPLPMN